MDIDLKTEILKMLEVRAQDQPFYEYFLCEIFAKLRGRNPTLSTHSLLETMFALIDEGAVEQYFTKIGEGNFIVLYCLNTTQAEQAAEPRGTTQRLMEEDYLKFNIPILYRSCACETNALEDFKNFHRLDKKLEEKLDRRRAQAELSEQKDSP